MKERKKTLNNKRNNLRSKLVKGPFNISYKSTAFSVVKHHIHFKSEQANIVLEFKAHSAVESISSVTLVFFMKLFVI